MRINVRLLSLLAVTALFSIESQALSKDRHSKPSLKVAVGKTIEVSIRNDLDHPITTDSQIDISLTADPQTRGQDQQAFWSPFDLARGRAVVVNEPSAQLRISAHSVNTYRISQNQLKWEKVIGAMWPSSPLAKIAAPGDYVLRVRGTASSNEVPVTVNSLGQISKR